MDDAQAGGAAGGRACAPVGSGAMAAPSVSDGIQARDVAVTLAGRRVLDGVGFGVPRARVTALVAPSGAGKSTLLRALVGLLPTAAGAITLDGEDIRSLDACVLRRRVGLVAQTPAMLPGTVADNLRHGVQGLTADALAAALDAASLEPARCQPDDDVGHAQVVRDTAGHSAQDATVRAAVGPAYRWWLVGRRLLLAGRSVLPRGIRARGRSPGDRGTARGRGSSWLCHP